MPESIGGWIMMCLIYGFIAWVMILLPLWFMVVEEPRERRDRAAHQDLCDCWSWMTDSDREWFAEQGVDDPRESRSR